MNFVKIAADSVGNALTYLPMESKTGMLIGGTIGTIYGACNPSYEYIEQGFFEYALKPIMCTVTGMLIGSFPVIGVPSLLVTMYSYQKNQTNQNNQKNEPVVNKTRESKL